MSDIISLHPCQHLVFCLLGALLGVLWCLIVVSLCISLMASDAEHLFKCLFANKLIFTSLVTCLLMSHGLITLFTELFTTEFWEWFYVLDRRPLSDWFSNIFSHFVACVFILLTECAFWGIARLHLSHQIHVHRRVYSISSFFFWCLLIFLKYQNNSEMNNLLKESVFLWLFSQEKFQIMKLLGRRLVDTYWKFGPQKDCMNL